MVHKIIMNHGNISLQPFFYALVLLSVYTSAAFGEADTKCIERERQALLTLKQGFTDEYGILSSWRSEEDTKDCCKWRGVSCSNQTGHVVMLDLSGYPLRGNMSSSLIVLQHLNYLDLSFIDFRGIQIPEFIGSLTKLRFLDLSQANFSGPIPSYAFCNMTSLVHLDLSTNRISQISSFPVNLVHLDLYGNDLEGPIPDYAFCNMTSLVDLELTMNHITGISKSFGDMCSLKTLNIYSNNLTGSLPDLFFNLSGCAKKSLEDLSLNDNMLSGSLPDITEFSSLRFLTISNNRLDGSFPEEFKQPSPLVELDLGANQLWGPLPDLSVFSLLTTLDISYNQLNGTVSQALGQLSQLEVLDLNSNSLQGMITEAHLSNLSKLITLHLSYNSLALNFSPHWVPPFQLIEINLRSCTVGPHFPKWLRSQKKYVELDLSNARIFDAVPDWFWDGLSNFQYLNLSNNQMKGKVSNLSSISYTNIEIDLSSNCFESSIPPIPSEVSSLLLSKNKFFGSISFLCNISSLMHLDLSNNQLSGEIPNCSDYWKSLIILNLANNNFSGRIPNLMDSNCNLHSLHLRNNSLTGELPSSLKQCKLLTVIDLGNNNIFGSIPSWIDDSLLNLTILSLRSNHINGNLPPKLCNLAKIQVLDVADNNISGIIPKCLNNLTTMVQIESPNAMIEYFFQPTRGSGVQNYPDEAWLMWKGVQSEYKTILGLVKSIDLSSNKLSEEIPEEVTNLVGLLSLNLSRNCLTGPIPPKIGQLTLVNSLDLSQNQLSGKIPESSTQLSHLGVLNLSNNNLSGKIPSGIHLQTFDASSFMGNPILCGSPLPNKCPGEEPAAPQDPPIVVHGSKDDGFITRDFYITAALGFTVGFWGFCGTLLLNKKWRCAYFQLLDNVKDKLFVLIAVKMANLKRLLVS